MLIVLGSYCYCEMQNSNKSGVPSLNFASKCNVGYSDSFTSTPFHTSQRSQDQLQNYTTYNAHHMIT
jgi:hypothetical protein